MLICYKIQINCFEVVLQIKQIQSLFLCNIYFQAYYFIKNAFQWKRKNSVSTYKLFYISSDVESGTFIGVLSRPVSIKIKNILKYLIVLVHNSKYYDDNFIYQQ